MRQRKIKILPNKDVKVDKKFKAFYPPSGVSQDADDPQIYHTNLPDCRFLDQKVEGGCCGNPEQLTYFCRFYHSGTSPQQCQQCRGKS